MTPSRQNLLSDICEAVARQPHSDDAKHLPLIRKADKFIFDAASVPSDLFFAAHDFADQLSQFGMLRLPFDTCVFQVGPIGEDDDNEVDFQIILAWHEGDDIVGRLYMATGLAGRPLSGVNFGRNTFRIPKGAIRREWQEGCFEPWCVRDSSPIAGNGHSGEMSDEEAARVGMALFGTFLFCALGCLAAEGIHLDTSAEPKFVNAKREAKGRAPLFGYHFVTIDKSAVRMPGIRRGDNEHASPRIHWRRGHIRRMKSGKIVVVRPCLVGDPNAGPLLSRAYRVAAQPVSVH